jgi:hypothetical protein
MRGGIGAKICAIESAPLRRTRFVTDLCCPTHTIDERGGCPFRRGRKRSLRTEPRPERLRDRRRNSPEPRAKRTFWAENDACRTSGLGSSGSTEKHDPRIRKSLDRHPARRRSSSAGARCGIVSPQAGPLVETILIPTAVGKHAHEGVFGCEKTNVLSRVYAPPGPYWGARRCSPGTLPTNTGYAERSVRDGAKKIATLDAPFAPGVR